jgi:hypothetical protein
MSEGAEREMTAKVSVVPVGATKQAVSDGRDKSGGLTVDGPGR